MAYALAFAPGPIGVTAGPLLGRALAPDAGWATLPLAVQLVAMMLAGVPAGRIMQRFGRRRGFQLGMAIGAAGGLCAAFSSGAFVLLLVGSAGLGFMLGFAQLFRFAAAELAPDEPSRAVGTVLVGGVAASILGPGIVFLARDWLPTPFAAAYLMAAALALLVALLVEAIPFAKIPPAAAARTAPPVRKRPVVMVGIGAAALGYGVMALVMTATPLAMADTGHGIGSTVATIMMHGVAMFAPSPLTGRLIGRYGMGPVMLGGWGTLVAACTVALLGPSFWVFAVALVLLGFGWNGLFVAGTTLVARQALPGEGPRLQGINDLFVLGAGAAGSLLAGVLLRLIGWQVLPLWLLVPLVGLGSALALGARGMTPRPA